MKRDYDEEVAIAIVEASENVGKALHSFGMEYLANEKCGNFLDSFSSMAESFSSIASSLEKIANALDGDQNNFEVLANAHADIAMALESKKDS